MVVFMLFHRCCRRMVDQDVECHDCGSRRGRTGRMRFPNEESWVMKKPEECAWACCEENKQKEGVKKQALTLNLSGCSFGLVWFLTCNAALCWAAMCCSSALSLNSFMFGLDSGMLRDERMTAAKTFTMFTWQLSSIFAPKSLKLETFNKSQF